MKEKENPVKMHTVELLGIGASMDRQLKTNLLQALWQLGLDIPVTEVREIDRLLESGVSGIPALVVNGQVILQKVVPSTEELRILLHALFKLSNKPAVIRNIVVPTDFSETAKNAYRYALELAGFLGASVRLVHVYQPETDRSGATLLDGVSEELHLKQELLQSLSQSAGISVAGRRIQNTAAVEPEVINGFVTDELCNLSRRSNTDLLVMGTTGQAKGLEKWLGSISTEVARKAHCPVVLVPRNSAFSPVKNLLYACDYQPNEGLMLDKVIGLASLFPDATVHLVHICTSRAQASAELSGTYIESTLEKVGVKLTMSKVHNPDILEAIALHAQNTQSSIIAMGTHHRSFLENLFHKKLTREMVFSTSLPLAIFHYQD